MTEYYVWIRRWFGQDFEIFWLEKYLPILAQLQGTSIHRQNGANVGKGLSMCYVYFMYINSMFKTQQSKQFLLSYYVLTVKSPQSKKFAFQNINRSLLNTNSQVIFKVN